MAWLRRNWRTIVGYVAKAVLVFAVGLAIGSVVAHWHWLIVHLSQESGTSTAGSRAYDWWSGAGSDIGEVTLIGALIASVHHVNCHNKGCLRLGKHTTPDGYKLCKKCVGKPKSTLTLHEVHKDHQ